METELAFALSHPSDVALIKQATPRKLRSRTIWFCDVVGFSEKMEKSETETISIMFQVMNLVEREIRTQGGNIVKTLGDGNFAIFENPLSAVYAAFNTISSIYRILHINTTIRIGIHRGHVFLQNDDYFGHAVNVASRLESIAPSNGIAISGWIYKVLPDDFLRHFKFRGQPKLKNLQASVDVYTYKFLSGNLPEVPVKCFIRYLTKFRLRNLLKTVGMVLGGAILIFAFSLIFGRILFDSRESAGIPRNRGRHLAILSFTADDPDVELLKKARQELAREIINRNISVYNIDVPLSADLLDNKTYLEEEKIYFGLSGDVQQRGAARELNWVLNDLRKNLTIDIGTVKFDSSVNLEKTAEEIIQAILQRIYLDREMKMAIPFEEWESAI